MENIVRSRLLLDHQRVLLSLDQFDRLLDTLTPETVAALVDARWSYARHILAHLDAEEQYVFGPLATDRRGEAAATAARFHTDREAIAAGLQAHARRY